MDMFDVNVVRAKAFMERSGAEQEFLRDYWFGHAKEIRMSLCEFMGMRSAPYEAWELGVLKLGDGSYHEMDASVFRLSSSEVEAVRSEILKGVYSFSAFSAVLNGLMPERVCSGYVDPGPGLAMIFNGGDDVVAVVSLEDVIYKEDFARMMKESGLPATEANFNEVWREFDRNLDWLPEMPLRGRVCKAVEEVAVEIGGKRLFEERLREATNRSQETVYKQGLSKDYSPERA